MTERMTFPETLDEFLELYQFKDKQEIYTNGAMLIPVFRVKQWEKHAADAIEKLVKEKEYLSEQVAYWQAETVKGDCDRWLSKNDKQRWIPVTERLPDFDGCVLCMKKMFVGDTLRHQDILYFEEGVFYMEFEDTQIPTELITHWMPLPEPPKEEE